MLESDGEALFHVRFGNKDYDGLEEFLRNDWVLPSLGDTGAHLTQIIDVGWSTFMLSHWHREKGTFSLAETIRSQPAHRHAFQLRRVASQEATLGC